MNLPALVSNPIRIFTPSTVAGSAAPAVYSTAVQQVTLSATVSSAIPANAGTVTFTVPGIGSVVATVSGGLATAALAIPAGKPAGTYPVQIAYSGDEASLIGPSTGSASLVIVRAPVTISWATPTRSSSEVRWVERS